MFVGPGSLESGMYQDYTSCNWLNEYIIYSSASEPAEPNHHLLNLSENNNSTTCTFNENSKPASPEVIHAMIVIVRPANRDWAYQTERCHTLSNKTSLQ